jgi:hypothetical protein
MRPLPPPSIMQQPRPQLRRPLGTYTREEKHPRSGGNPYSQDMREKVIAQHQLGLPIVTPELTALHQQYQYPSVWTCRRYIRQFNASEPNSTNILQCGRAGGISGNVMLPVMLDQNMQQGITWLIAKYSGGILFGWRCTKLGIQRVRSRKLAHSC